MKIKTGTSPLQAAAVDVVAKQLNEAISKGTQQGRGIRRAVQIEIDKRIEVGPRQISLLGRVVCLAVLVVSGYSGFLWTADRDWVASTAIAVLAVFGIFLLDQVRLLQSRETSLKAGLYTTAADESVASAVEGAQVPSSE
ncbi:hypothetical protein JNUCC0626_32240 [Lentzea sp. JNUCC 0626]|uniref:hypothetical protein n=1 Tax=Lentzea sp. JNUCC 0626 TaxID=3367513 RepID=UPI0037485633